MTIPTKPAESEATWDAYAQAALIGLIASGRYSTVNFDCREIVTHAMLYADAAMKAKAERYRKTDDE